MTEVELRAYVALKLAGDPEIEASAHRDVENAIIDFIVSGLGTVTKSKVLLLESFTTDRNYTIATALPVAAIIDSVVVMLVCKVANNGFSIGDVVTAPTPYPRDSGRTDAQGIGVQYNNLSNGSIKVMVNDQLTIMTAYNSTPNAVANNILISGGGAANWSIKLIVGYK
ncbi:hypothetical protein [Flavobacterium sp. SLB02]|uniref:hypothetical protein n=1 Tax=Flavobacterium sp. SLB02 TaxID=2665645 RepID=UPI0012A9F5BE|nr:hypothetical protein [Flavobacterium sp. SLB02]QGK72852.1 hypothetical protein GIY83_01825 [Flavobacterium sp. SLB02]